MKKTQQSSGASIFSNVQPMGLIQQKENMFQNPKQHTGKYIFADNKSFASKGVHTPNIVAPASHKIFSKGPVVGTNKPEEVNDTNMSNNVSQGEIQKSKNIFTQNNGFASSMTNIFFNPSSPTQVQQRPNIIFGEKNELLKPKPIIEESMIMDMNMDMDMGIDNKSNIDKETMGNSIQDAINNTEIKINGIDNKQNLNKFVKRQINTIEDFEENIREKYGIIKIL